jgi:hypothetical protein
MALRYIFSSHTLEVSKSYSIIIGFWENILLSSSFLIHRSQLYQLRFFCVNLMQ